MRIGFEAKRFFCNYTGIGNYSRTLLSGLLEYAPENEYYLYSPKLSRNAQTEYAFSSEALQPRSTDSVLKSYWRSVSVKKDLKKDKIELYHGLSHELPIGIEKMGIPSVLTMHDVIYKSFPSMYTWADRKIYDFKFRHACRCADKIVAISNSTKRDLEYYYGISPDKIEVIYQSVSPLFYSPQSEEELKKNLASYILPEKFLLYVGSINARKNLLTLVQALAQLPKSYKLPLWVVGEGHAYKSKVKEYIRDHKMENEVMFLSHLQSLEILQAFYQKATMICFPSFYEGFGLPVCEAILSNTPALISNTSSLPEAGGPDAFYADPHSPEAIAAQIQLILEMDSSSLNLRCQKAKAYVWQKFAPEKGIQQYIGLYKALV